MQFHTIDVSSKKNSSRQGAKDITKPRRKFIIGTMVLFLSMRGKHNFKGMDIDNAGCQ